jgi:hypothetical protein
LDPVLAAIKPEARLAALNSIQGRVADLMFVELLFEKGPREVDMILNEYNWKKAVLVKRQEALDAALSPDPDHEPRIADGSEDENHPGPLPFLSHPPSSTPRSRTLPFFLV